MRSRRLIGLVIALVLAGCSSTAEGPAEPTVGCPAPNAADMTEISGDRAASVVGMTEIEAADCAASLGWGFRVGRRDEESFLLTADYVPSRITVEVESGVVVSVSVG